MVCPRACLRTSHSDLRCHTSRIFRTFPLREGIFGYSIGPPVHRHAGGAEWKHGVVHVPQRRDHPMLVSEVIDHLAPIMERRGFERRRPELAEALPRMWVCSWVRDPPQERFRVGEWPDGSRDLIGFGDHVTVWRGEVDYIIFQVAELFARVEWRNSPLDADEFAYVIGGMVDQVDRFAGHTGPPLRRGGWTRG